MKVKYIRTADITPYERNAKKHPKHQVEQIAESLQMFGWQQPLVIDRDGVIVIGHGRFMAAEQLGRTAYIMELDPGYCDVIIDRWEEFTGGKAVRID